jgi:hypothetical protein
MLTARPCVHCGEDFRPPRGNHRVCSAECRKLRSKEQDSRRDSERPKAPGAAARKVRPTVARKLDPRACRDCKNEFEPLRSNQARCYVCHPITWDLRRCTNCQKPFRALRRNSMFCDSNCSARWHDLQRRKAEPVDRFDQGDDNEGVLVLDLEDAPRRVKLFEAFLRFGHPVWADAVPADSKPQSSKRPTYAEEFEAMYPNGPTAPPVKTASRHGR